MPPNLIELNNPDDLIRQYAVPLYRYHLSHRGERPAALALTIATLRSALAWLDTYRPSPRTPRAPSLPAWLFAIARYKQAYALRKFTTTKPPSPPSVMHPSSPPLVRGVGGIPDPVSEAVPLWHAQMAWLADALRQLPQDQAETLALVYFAGLNPDETAAVLRKTPRQVEQLLKNRLAEPQQLIDLANDITLDESELEAIQNGVASQPASHPAWLHHNFWLQAFGLRSSLSRVVPAAGLAVLLLVIFIYFSIPSPVKSEALQANSQPFSIATTANRDTTPGTAALAQSVRGYLVPPNLDECIYWQNYLSSIFLQKPDLISVAPFQNPLAKGPDESGTGCELDLTGLGPGPQKIPSAVQTIRPLFVREGYKAFSLPNCGDSKPDGDVFCTILIFTRSEYGRALLMISGRPVGMATPCPTEPPESPTPGISCYYSYSNIEFTVRLQLAASPAQIVVDDFLSQWKAGSSQVVNHLSGQLRISLPNLSSLDKLANIDRSPAGAPSFSAQVVDNSGDTVVVDVQVDEIRKLPLPSHLVSTVQLRLTRNNNNWLIQAIKADPLTAIPGG